MNRHEPTGKAPQYVERTGGCQPGWRQKVDNLLDVLMPACCVACGLPAPASGLCPGCRAGMPHCRNACPACGLPFAGSGAIPCGACQNKPPPWSSMIAAAWYGFPVKELIRRFKFRRDLAAGRALTHILLERLEAAAPPRPDRVMPVPLHGWRLFRRGFDQAFEIARPIGRAFGLELSLYELSRPRYTRTQAGLDARQRRRNLVSAFEWRGPPLTGQRIALVDDVVTTGSTAGECARVLRHAGAAHVDIWALARAPRP